MEEYEIEYEEPIEETQDIDYLGGLDDWFPESEDEE